MLNLIVTWIVTTVSLMIISRLNIGIEVEDMNKALIAALVIGLVNAIIGPIVGFIAFPITVLTLGLFALVINALLFGLAAYLVKGFRLRNGFWSALIGSILLSIINTVIFWILGLIGLG